MHNLRCTYTYVEDPFVYKLYEIFILNLNARTF